MRCGAPAPIKTAFVAYADLHLKGNFLHWSSWERSSDIRKLLGRNECASLVVCDSWRHLYLTRVSQGNISSVRARRHGMQWIRRRQTSSVWFLAQVSPRTILFESPLDNVFVYCHAWGPANTPANPGSASPIGKRLDRQSRRYFGWPCMRNPSKRAGILQGKQFSDVFEPIEGTEPTVNPPTKNTSRPLF